LFAADQVRDTKVGQLGRDLDYTKVWVQLLSTTTPLWISNLASVHGSLRQCCNNPPAHRHNDWHFYVCSKPIQYRIL